MRFVGMGVVEPMFERVWQNKKEKPEKTRTRPLPF
jgi:hypothetical protein